MEIVTTVDVPEDACCPREQHLLDDTTTEQLTTAIKALADPVRLRVFHHIAASRCTSVCACHMPDVFGVSQPTLSHHLKKLTEAGLVDREMRGRWAHYTLRPEGLTVLRTFLDEIPSGRSTCSPERPSMPSLMFVCIHNAGRSQMAAAYAHHLSGGAVEVRSAGSAPAETINPAVRDAMLEEGIDISHEKPKILTPEAVQASDVVITMGCGDTCPYFPGKRYEDWKLDDPAGQGIDAVRPIRDEIRRRITALLVELGVEVREI